MYEPPINREAWLGQVAGHLRPLFDEQGAPLPVPIRMSCSWPGRPSRVSKKVRMRPWRR